MHSVHKMRPIATDGVAWSICLSVYLSVCVCPLVTFVSPAKTAEPTEMQFKGLTQVSSRNTVLNGVKIGRIHSHLRGVTSRQCSVLPHYIGYLFCSVGYSQEAHGF